MTTAVETMGESEVEFGWGVQAIRRFGPIVETIVVVDVLSFCTCVGVAIGRGCTVVPSRVSGVEARELAARLGAELASRRGEGPFSLSPPSLERLSEGATLVLPSPNGATLSLEAAKYARVVAACLRNASAVAEFCREVGGRVALIAAGERWPDGSLRPALEDYLGAGAIAAASAGRRLSPDANAAAVVFEAMRGNLEESLMRCPSGVELEGIGFRDDVVVAAQLDSSGKVPVLDGQRFVAGSADA